MSDLFQYNHILNQRNKLLKDIAQKESLKSTLDIWDEQLVRYGASVIRSRREFVCEMNEVIQRIHSSITGEKEQIELIYEPNVEEEQFLEILLKNREKDFKFKNSRNYAIKINCSVANGVASFQIWGFKQEPEYEVSVSANVTSRTSSYIKSATYRTLKLNGEVVKTENAKQPFEIKANNIDIVNVADSDYPLQKKRHSFEYLRTVSHLRPRTNTFNAVFRVRSVLSFAIHKFFNERGFVYVHTPIITGSDCEGAGEMFQVTTLDVENAPKNADGSIDYSQDFFGKQAHLTVSGQLDVETYAHAFRNVYTFGPTFRAENSNTVKHAAEFWMIEPEICFADLNDDMNLAEDMIKYIISYVLENAPEEM